VARPPNAGTGRVKVRASRGKDGVPSRTPPAIPSNRTRSNSRRNMLGREQRGPAFLDNHRSAIHIETYIKKDTSPMGDCTRTTPNIDDEPLDQTTRLTGIREKTSLVKQGCERLSRQKVRKGSLNWEDPRKGWPWYPAEDLREADMLLVDTPVWVPHFRHGTAGLETRLEEAQVVWHPFLIGKIACGDLKNRVKYYLSCRLAPWPSRQIMRRYCSLSKPIDLFMGQGLGCVDMHLPISAALSDVPLWTFERKLNKTASMLGLDHLSAGSSPMFHVKHSG
jgi:hypothetical protein